MIEASFRAAGTLIGLLFGIVGAAAGLSLATLVSAPLIAWIIGRERPVSFTDQLRAFSRALPISAGVLAACLLTHKLLGDTGVSAGLLTLLVMIGTGVLGGGIVGLCVASTRRMLIDLLRRLSS